MGDPQGKPLDTWGKTSGFMSTFFFLFDTNYLHRLYLNYRLCCLRSSGTSTHSTPSIGVLLSRLLWQRKIFMVSFLRKNKFILTLLISGGIFIICSYAVFAAFEVGNSREFFVDSSFDYNTRTKIVATLKNISANAYFYVEDPFWQELSLAQQSSFLDGLNDIAAQFDEKTYPSLKYVFGSEWNPGIDNDERITILFTQLKKTAGGYFNERDEISSLQEPTSNNREMIYINASQVGNNLVHGLIAHELQHMINWNQKQRLNNVQEDIWLNEMRSEYASTVAGLDSDYVSSNLERRVEDFLFQPSDSLTEWKGDRYDYPSVNLLGHYLAEQFGEDIFSSMIKNNKVGIYSIEQALKEKGYSSTFSQIFNNWAIADYLNDKSIYNGIYGYKNPYLNGNVQISPITYSIVSASVINIAQQVKDWAPYWYRFINKQDASTIAKDLEIEFEGSMGQGSFNVYYVVDYIDQPTVVGKLTLENQSGILKIPDFKTKVDSVTITVSNQFKKSDFQSNESANPFILSAFTTLFDGSVEPPGEELPKPEDYGLKEGDLIRAVGDFDIFIISQRGYKRLFLNPAIFDMYGHLTGGWKAVKTVSPEVRDAFKTSNYYRYVNEDKVYKLEISGEDTGTLYWLNMTGENFLSQGGKPESIFIINRSELDWYPKGEDKTTL